MENPRQQIDANPWKGLNFYSEIDRNNFYGRDEEIQSLSLYITNNIQTILYGKSGIGKSSIIYAGVFPAARQAGLFPISIRFSHDEKTNYIEQIRLALERAGIGITERVPRIEGHEESLWEFMHRHSFTDPVTDEPTRPLIVMDQFEEIFTLQKDEKKKLAFFAELADLLNGVTPKYIVDAQSTSTSTEKKTKKGGFVLDLGTSNEDEAEDDYINESLFNMVFVIREDFLSYMERYTKFIPVMKTNRYALLPLNEEQAADIIMKPQPGLVSKEVAKLIIQKVTGRTDFELEGTPEIEVDAAVLSLFLSGLYRKKEEQGLQTITAELVNQAGEFIIRDFYMDSINGLSEHDIEVLEDELLTSDGRRNNVSRNDLIREGLSEEAIKELVENQKLLRQFSYQDDIRIEYMHDILCPVVSERIEQRENAKRMEAERLRQEEEQRRLLAEEQRKREAIEAKAKADKERLEKEAREARLKSRKRFNISIITVLVLGIIGGAYYFTFKKTYSVYYANFTTEHGWPIGIGEPIRPGSEQTKDLLQLYKLTKQGLKTLSWKAPHYFQIETVSPDGVPVMNMLYEWPVVGLIESEFNDPYSQEFAKLQQKTAIWRYIPNTNDEMATCIAYTLNDSILYSIQYYRDDTHGTSDTTNYTQWAVFYDGNGKQMMVSGKGTDRMRQTIHKGLITSCMFFTELGVPQQDAYGHYGYAYENDYANHRPVVRYNVNEFGERIEESILQFKYDPITGQEDGTAQFEMKYENGRRIIKFPHFSDTIQYRSNGALAKGTFHLPGGAYSLVAFKYDEQGKPLMNQKYRNDSLIESTLYTYQEGTDRPRHIKHLKDGIAFIEKFTYPDTSSTIVSLWKNDHEKMEVRRSVNEFNDTLTYHEYRIRKHKDSVYLVTTVTYLDSCGRLIDETKGDYAKRSTKTDRRIGKPKTDYYYLANNDIYKSTWYDYDDYGRLIAQAVAGIDGDPVRSPNWDWDNWCYYKVALLKDKTKIVYVAMQGYDEFGDEAYVIQNSAICKNRPMPLDDIQAGVQYIDNFREYNLGLRLAQTQKIEITGMNLVSVPFLQILKREGTMYKGRPYKGDRPEGPKHPADGDVLYRVGAWHLYQSEALLKNEWEKFSKQGGDIEVLRAEGKGRKEGTKDHYTRHTFHIDAGSYGATYHIMPILPSQQDRIKFAIL